MDVIERIEEKLTRWVTLAVVMFSVFVCSCLYYLPDVELKAGQLIAQYHQKQELRAKRQEMLAQMSGLEFLVYATAQIEEAQQVDSGLEMAESTTFEQQLRIQLPKNVAPEDVTVTNNQVERSIQITMPKAGEDYLINYPMIGKSDHIEALDYYSKDRIGTIALQMERVYELDLTWEDSYLYVDFVAPKDLYEHVVVVDAGHGASMPGAIVKGVQEKDIDLAIVEQLKKLFEEHPVEGLKVYYTRLDDTDPSFYDRIGLANLSEADLFVSVHNNSYSSSSVHGTAVMYNEKEKSSQIKKNRMSSKELSGIFLKHQLKQLGSKDMGLVFGNEIYVLRTAEVPAALIEVGFMSNPTELANLMDEEYQTKSAQAIYDGILEALDLQP